MEIGTLSEFVKSFLDGYMEGHREELEELEPEEIELKIAEAKGWATGYYKSISGVRQGADYDQNRR